MTEADSADKHDTLPPPPAAANRKTSRGCESVGERDKKDGNTLSWKTLRRRTGHRRDDHGSARPPTHVSALTNGMSPSPTVDGPSYRQNGSRHYPIVALKFLGLVLRGGAPRDVASQDLAFDLSPRESESSCDSPPYLPATFTAYRYTRANSSSNEVKLLDGLWLDAYASARNSYKILKQKLRLPQLWAKRQWEHISDDVYRPYPGTGAEGNLAEREIADQTDRPISENVSEDAYSDKKQHTCLSRIYFNATFKSSPLPRW